MWSYVQYRRISSCTEQDRGYHGSQQKIDSSNDVDEKPHDHLRKSKEVESWTPPPDRENLRQAAQPKATENKGKPKNSNDDGIPVRIFGEDDSFDPHNWPLRSRIKNMIILGLLVFTQAWAAAADSMANASASKEFHVGRVTQSLSTALYLFGIATGCIFVGLISETVARNPTYLVSTFLYLLFVLGSALSKTAGSMYTCRYFVGLFASATLGINGASVRDQFRPVKTAFVFPFIAWVNVARKHSEPLCLRFC
jgi:MFS transporter, DHA1 family, multidrug resistance protein